MTGEASEAIVRGLKSAGVDLVAMLPDHGFDRVQKKIAEDDTFTFVPVSNEGIGVGVCAGAFFGGKVPALMIPTSGFLVATWPLASLHNLWNLPLLLLIPVSRRCGRRPTGHEDLQFTTEPILRDLQIPYVLVNEVSKVEGAIKDAVASAFAWQNPICLLFAGETLR